MRTIGIDLGTTNTVVSLKENDEIKVLEADNGFLIPSVFYYNKNKNLRIVGKRAKNRGLIDPKNYITTTKRYIDSSQKKFTASNETFSAQDIATEILLKVKKTVYDYIGQEDELEAVITVPNNFSTMAVENTKQAGMRAGFKSVSILKEPIAAVLAYGEQIRPDDKALYFVCDFGGGTLDIAVIQYDENGYEVIATGGDDKLGGEDFTQAMIHFCDDYLLEKEKIDFSLESIENEPVLQAVFSQDEIYQRAKAKIAQKAELAKIALSVEDKTTIEIPELLVKNGKLVSFVHDITAEEFNHYPEVLRLIRRFREAVEDVIRKLSEQNISVNDISHVLYVGGSMNLPMAKSTVRELIPVNVLDDNLDTVVSIGACSKIDIKKRIIPKLNDHIGVKVDGDTMSVIIPAQSNFPISVSKYYTTSANYQTEISFEVYEGNNTENIYASENHWLGELTIQGIEPKIEGEAVIEVTFTLDKEGILKISALDTKTNHEVHTELNYKELRK